MKNRALRTEPRYEPARVIPVKKEMSLMEWLEQNNRIIPRETSLNIKTSPQTEETVDVDSKELSDFIEEESSFELDDDEEVEEI